jgi:hypothetical protein
MNRNLKKEAYLRLIKNFIFKNKFSRFMDQISKRLLEKAFDKIKENNWIVDERKEMLEVIIKKRILK